VAAIRGGVGFLFDAAQQRLDRQRLRRRGVPGNDGSPRFLEGRVGELLGLELFQFVLGLQKLRQLVVVDPVGPDVGDFLLREGLFQPARGQDLVHVPHDHFQEGNDLVRPHVRKEDDPRGPPQVQLPVEVPERLARAAGQGNILAGQGVLRDSYLEAFFRKGDLLEQQHDFRDRLDQEGMVLGVETYAFHPLGQLGHGLGNPSQVEFIRYFRGVRHSVIGKGVFVDIQ
jgi:hypothetical protein